MKTGKGPKNICGMVKCVDDRIMMVWSCDENEL